LGCLKQGVQKCFDPIGTEWQEAGQNCVMASFIIVFVARLYLDVQIKEDVMSGTLSAHGGLRSAYVIIVGRPQGKRSVCRLKRRLVNNIGVVLSGTEFRGMDWIHLVLDRDWCGILRTW
jgi:hypothetical protein